MAEVRLSASAARDLRRIREVGVSEHGVMASNRYMAGFDRLFALLRQQPMAGQERSEFRQRMRSLSHRPYRILYRIEGDGVVIDRIIHQSRDVRRVLKNDH